MNAEKFLSIYNESRNGCNSFYRHPLIRKFLISDGVKELADEGCWWLIDIAATELPTILRKVGGYATGTLVVTAKDGKADLEMTGCGDIHLWKKKIDMTDLPEGRFVFLVADSDHHFNMILISEY